jgi:thiol-disulfide isomerase/thioredoxin
MLYFYYGEECPHCHDAMPLVDKLIEEGTKIEKLETWHNEANAKQLEVADGGKCGGVPFFINDESGEWICGATSEEMLRKWASGEKLS